MQKEFAVTRGSARIVFGVGSSQRLGDELRALGAARSLIVTTPGRKALAEGIASALGPLCVGVLATATSDPLPEVAEGARAEIKRTGADWIIAVGEDSAIALGKALALTEPALLAVLPTTYSGAEMTSLCEVEREGQDGPKAAKRDGRARPRLVVYDPALSTELAADIAVASAFSALAHAVDAACAGRDPLVSVIAEESIRALASALRALRSAPLPLAAHSQAFYGAHLAGVCLEETGPGLHHALCHVLGKRLGLTHAAVSAVLLPHVVALYAAAAEETVQPLARALGSSGASHAAGALFDLAAETGVPADLRSLGMQAGDIDRAAALATSGLSLSLSLSAGPASVEQIRALLDSAYHGRRPGTASRPPTLPISITAPKTETGPAASGELTYLSGFHSTMQSEALPGALPRTQNSPKQVPYGLYTECINGTPFTMERAHNLSSWLYRIRPSAVQSPMQKISGHRLVGHFDHCEAVPSLLRWKPLALPPADRAVDFVDGLATLGGAGNPDLRSGLAIHLYAANSDMRDRSFTNADGDLLIVPELGRLRIRTEFGWLDATPGEIALLQRGMRFSVELPDRAGRGFVLESFSNHFRLPERGPLGATGLASERHFLAPTAAYEDRPCPGYELIVKYSGELFRSTVNHSPYDVIAWHGNYAPYKYNLALFNTMGSVSFDHPDPSIFTVLTVPLDDHGTNLADFVVFPGRWEVAEHTFRPPYYHRNIATEFSGIVSIDEAYSGFDKGCYFLTPSMTPHGIGAPGYLGSLTASDKPRRLPDESLWIMFESALNLRLTPWAARADNLDDSYYDLWNDMPVTYKPPQ